MPRDPHSFLWDMDHGCSNIRQFPNGVALEDYLGSELLRSAVGRQLQNTGEAMAQPVRIGAALAARVPDHRQLIAFRNVPVHGYAALNHHEVWRAIAESLPPLQQAVARPLAEAGPPAGP